MACARSKTVAARPGAPTQTAKLADVHFLLRYSKEKELTRNDAWRFFFFKSNTISLARMEVSFPPRNLKVLQEGVGALLQSKPRHSSAQFFHNKVNISDPAQSPYGFGQDISDLGLISVEKLGQIDRDLSEAVPWFGQGPGSVTSMGYATVTCTCWCGVAVVVHLTLKYYFWWWFAIDSVDHQRTSEEVLLASFVDYSTGFHLTLGNDDWSRFNACRKLRRVQEGNPASQQTYSTVIERRTGLAMYGINIRANRPDIWEPVPRIRANGGPWDEVNSGEGLGPEKAGSWGIARGPDSLRSGPA
ncbi:hypothetical protein GGX14DRAFT_389585 [Mycena pura]|uniref:Uncharacterized protein n=1 Tax=Mycena pura TaxID=153505 RepID=A0AAD6VQX4_9AGAR|nr:hypothetical protein GGX14DRAFT_389585 [Mycena pura]